MHCQLDFFHCQVWESLSAVEHKKWFENLGTARTKVTQMMRCTASLTFFTARFGLVSVLKNTSRCVKECLKVCIREFLTTHKLILMHMKRAYLQNTGVGSA